MLLHETRSSRTWIFIGVGALIALCIVFSMFPGTETSAQSAPLNMEQFLMSLRERIERESGFVIVFRFSVPLSNDGDTRWVIPYEDDALGISRHLGDIGEDYVCFYEVAGQAPAVTCTPFTNIVTVGFLEAP